MRTYYYQNNLECFAQADGIAENDICEVGQNYSFTLMGGNGGDVNVNYVFSDSVDKLFKPGSVELVDVYFDKAKNACPDVKSAIIVLDWMADDNGSSNGQLALGRETLHRLLAGGISGNNIYVLTGFEKTAYDQISGRLDRDHILTKPIDASKLSDVLLKAIGGGCNE